MLVAVAVAMVLGGGASLAAPSSRPLFAWLREALVKQLELPTGSAFDDKRFEHLAPEALLSRLARRGVDIDAELRLMLAGGEPNALHFAAAAVLARGQPVWTTNFDELVEDAAGATGVSFHRLVASDDPTRQCDKVDRSLTGGDSGRVPRRNGGTTAALRDDRQRRPALAGSIGAARAPTVSMISLLSIPCR